MRSRSTTAGSTASSSARQFRPKRTALQRRGARAERASTAPPIFPVAGICATLCGTLVSMALVPDNPVPRGALVVPGLAMIVGLLSAPAWTMLYDLRSALRAENILAAAVVFWIYLDLVPGAYEMEPISRAEVRGVFGITGVFVIAMWAATLQQAWRIPGAIRKTTLAEWSGASYFYFGLVAFTLGFLRFAIPVNFDLRAIIYYMGEMRWAAPWGRGQLGGWNAFLDVLQYFGYMVPMLTVLAARRLGWLNGRVLLLVCLTLVIVLLLAQGGGRRIVGTLGGSAILCWVLSAGKLKARRLLVGTAGALALLTFLQVMLEYRGVGLASAIDSEKRAEVGGYAEFRVDDNFLRMAQMIQIIPSRHPYVYHRYFLWVLVRPIPRVFWPGKPVDPGFSLPEYLGRDYVSYSCTVIGELWMAGGVLAVAFGGWLYGRLARTASSLISRNMAGGALFLYGAFVLALFTGIRSGLNLILMNYVVFFWLVLVAVSRGFGVRYRVADAPVAPAPEAERNV